MKNRKLARFLLWTIMVIGMIPVLLRVYIPSIPDLMVGVGLMIATISAIAMRPKTDDYLGKGSKAPMWLWSVWLVTIVIFLIGNMIPTIVPIWLKWVAAIIGLACVMLKKSYDKDDQLADSIDGRIKKMFRRS
jgi:hypothetical protein